MSRLATARDFGLDGSPGVLYTQYDPLYPFLQARAATIQGRFATKTTKILIAGCGMGSLVRFLTDAGYTDVWGCDASAYIIGQGRTRWPDIAARLLIADALNNSGNQLPSMTGVRRAAGLTGGNRFPLCVTDDLLTVMSDAEVQTALTVLRATATTLVHVLWTLDPFSTQDPSLNWKTVPAGWQAVIGGGEWVMDAVSGIIYGANGLPV
jgi:SAM-dependent methyltransferase